MVGVGALVTGVAPLAGGVLLGGMAGKSGPSVPDLRAVILSDLELLQRIPEAEVARRAALKRMSESTSRPSSWLKRRVGSLGGRPDISPSTGATSCCLSRPCCSS